MKTVALEKPQSQTAPFKVLRVFLQRVLRFSKCLSKKNDSLFCGDAELVESELTETGHTIENKCFKKVSCIDRAVTLSYESLKRSILKEMKKAGRIRLLYDIASENVTTKDDLLAHMAEASAKEINVVLLWSAFLKKWQFVEALVCIGANVAFSEATHGLTALHIAAFTGCTESTKFLIGHGSNINLINKYYSPLHCATLAKRVENAKILLEAGARVDSMTNGPGYETPLYIAVKVNAIDCVQLFIDRGAQIYQEGKLGDLSPLFLAAELGHDECLKIILQQKNVNCNELKQNKNGNTALHVAAEFGHTNCIDVLLDKEADPNITNFRSQSPLHLAVKANSYTSVVSLIRHGRADLNLKDYNLRTPLHVAIELVADSRKDIVKVLIGNGADVNVQDQHGFTPLHVAALNELTLCADVLIGNGADYSIKSKSGITAISLIAKKIPSVLEAIRDKLTESITLVYHSEALNEVEMRFDFKNGLHHPKEYSMLNAFIDAGHKEMLLHPYIKAFLYVTWGRIRRCYYGMIYNSLLFSLVLLFYVLTALAYECDKQINDATINVTVNCTNRDYLYVLLRHSPISLKTQWYILLYCTLSLAYRKIYGFQGYPSLKQYCMNWGNIMEWHGIIYVFLISCAYTGTMKNWQLYTGAFAVMCAWTNIMFQIGQLPLFGPYVEMFQKVNNEFQKLLLVFFPFFVGYTVAFCVIFPNSSAFHNPFIGFLSAVVMMTGDMNYNILLDYSKEENTLDFAKFCAHLAFTCFLLFFTIILMNLLVGIAVNDIQGLQKNAGLQRLVRQAKVCCYIERSHYNRSPFAKAIMTLLRVVPKAYVPILKVKPLDPEEKPALKEIIQAAYDLAKKREIKKKNLINRTRSDGGPWRRLLNGSLTQEPLKWGSNLNQLIHKMSGQTAQINGLRRQIEELKEVIKSGFPITPIKEKDVPNYELN